jgi:hypothetical protein
MPTIQLPNVETQFKSYQPGDEVKGREFREVSQKSLELAQVIQRNVQSEYEMAQAIEHVQEAMHWALAGITKHANS